MIQFFRIVVSRLFATKINKNSLYRNSTDYFFTVFRQGLKVFRRNLKSENYN